MNFSAAITIDIGDAHAEGQGKRSRAKVTEVKTNFAPIWAFPDQNTSLKSQMATKWCKKLEVAWKRCPVVFFVFFFKVICQILRS